MITFNGPVVAFFYKEDFNFQDFDLDPETIDADSLVVVTKEFFTKYKTRSSTMAAHIVEDLVLETDTFYLLKMQGGLLDD